MKKYKIGICASFGATEKTFDGQTVKTKNIYKLLKEELGEECILTLNTHGWRNKMFKTFIDCIKLAKECENVIIMPAQNGIKVFAPVFSVMKKLFGFSLNYVVVGGWLPEMVSEKKWLGKVLKNFDMIFVETKTMQKGLNTFGIEKVIQLPNFKDITPLDDAELVYSVEPPYKLCTFSRVMKEKGIEDAVNAVTELNTELGYEAYKLDIYGNVDTAYAERFDELKKTFAPYIQYKGCIAPEKSVETIKEYFALLFPTYYEGEGFAGTVIDAFSAGVPIIATNWKYNAEIITNNVNGIIYDRQKQTLNEVLREVLTDIQQINSMKINCIAESKDYTPKTVGETLIRAIMK